MSDWAVIVEHLSKRYTLGRGRAKGDGMRHAIERAIRRPVSFIRSLAMNHSRNADFWALKDVSFSIRQGEVVGIIGRNGAGKSTLLKILSRITVPTEGRVRIQGRTASLLEVGTGFHQELTGRENIFLNGAILGMARAEISRKFDEIVAFSEVEDFLDTPVKRYSSGMYVRLAFAVAAHLEPEVLIVDEVLAVGDAAFQKKCLGKMGDFAQSGRTVLFVSHNMEAVRNLCQRAVWMKDGRLHREGPVSDVADDYFNATVNNQPISIASPTYGLTITKVVLKNVRGEECNQFRPGEELTVAIHYEADAPIEKPYVVLAIQGINGSCFTANMLLDGNRPEVLNGTGVLSCRFEGLPLFPQNYSVRMSIKAKNGNDAIVNYSEVAFFNIVADLGAYGYKGEFVSRSSGSTPVVVPYEWRLPDGTTAHVSLAAPR